MYSTNRFDIYVQLDKPQDGISDIVKRSRDAMKNHMEISNAID